MLGLWSVTLSHLFQHTALQVIMCTFVLSLSKAIHPRARRGETLNTRDRADLYPFNLDRLSKYTQKGDAVSLYHLYVIAISLDYLDKEDLLKTSYQ